MKQPDFDVFGDVWVYCKQHLRPHKTGWCSVAINDKTPLKALTEKDAYLECKERGFNIFCS